MFVTGYHNKEERIFSRKRIIIPKIKKIDFSNGTNNNNGKKAVFKIAVLLVIEIVVARMIINSVNPILNQLCSNEAKNIATMISNEQAGIVMKRYSYEDLVTIIKDDSGRVQMVKLNIITANQIISEVTMAIQEGFNNKDSSYFCIRLGSFSGTKILSGRGPKIRVKISSAGHVDTSIKSEFKSAGINQTLHQIYLEVNCKVCIVTPFDSVNENITNQILIAESIIVGDIPSSYYYFGGSEAKDAMETID